MSSSFRSLLSLSTHIHTRLCVQRASQCFHGSLCGLPFPSSGMRPARRAVCSSFVLRCLGASTMLGIHNLPAHRHYPICLLAAFSRRTATQVHQQQSASHENPTTRSPQEPHRPAQGCRNTSSLTDNTLDTA